MADRRLDLSAFPAATTEVLHRVIHRRVSGRLPLGARIFRGSRLAARLPAGLQCRSTFRPFDE
jgi:hypothetical protein